MLRGLGCVVGSSAGLCCGLGVRRGGNSGTGCLNQAYPKGRRPRQSLLVLGRAEGGSLISVAWTTLGPCALNTMRVVSCSPSAGGWRPRWLTASTQQEDAEASPAASPGHLAEAPSFPPATSPHWRGQADGSALHRFPGFGASARGRLAFSSLQRARNAGLPRRCEDEGTERLPGHRGPLRCPLSSHISGHTGLLGTGCRPSQSRKGRPCRLQGTWRPRRRPRPPKAKATCAHARRPARPRAGLWGGRATPRADWWCFGPAFG